MNHPVIRRALVCAFTLFGTGSLAAWAADPATLEAQRLQLQRAQQQNELQLRMQQYQQSVLTPPSTVNERLRQNELDLSQRWRQQQLHREQLDREQALRAIPDAGDPASQRQFEIMRSEREGQAQLQQFRRESEAAGAAGSAAPSDPASSPGAR
ncbi:MAG TPA: hypothetical protein VLN59_00205 [Burkholderiales bacterium]|nr:hypothetical protein [Burkholderiales bacterium]